MSANLVVKMWGLLFVVCTLLSSFKCEEYAPTQGLADEEKDLIYRIVKRLEKSSETSGTKRVEDTPTRSETKSCSVLTSKENKFVTSHNGAQYLKLLKNVESTGACVDHCCENPPCDTAVYKKEDHKCFLYYCQSNCKFSRHQNYTSFVVVRHASTPQPSTPTPQIPTSVPAREKWNDLDTDGNDGDDRDTRGDAIKGEKSRESVKVASEDATTTSAVPSATKTTVSTANVQPNSGKVCPAGSFECHSPVQDRIQCVSEKEVCDTIEQCADGSDEYNCIHSESVTKGTTLRPEEKGQPDSDEEENQEEEIKEENQHTSEDETQEKSHDSSEEENHHGSVEEILEENQHSLQEEQQVKTQPSSEEENQHGSEQGEQPSSEEEEHTGEDSDEPSGDRIITSTNATTTTTPTTTTTTPTTTTPTTTTISPTTTHSDFIAREKVADATEESNLQVPIIALSVGLAFTVILLIFVACRLCRVRRQLRKSRPLHSNEADYLINGMYL